MTDISATPRRDIAADITERILRDLERGTMPWKKPWDGARAGPALLPRRAGGEYYRGVNVVLLWSAACANGYALPWWLTFRQAALLGARVRKGERGEIVVYYGRKAVDAGPQKPDAPERTVRFLKSYVVFNAAQIDGLPAQYLTPPPPPTPPKALDWHECWFRRLGVDRFETSDRACYSPSRDAIGMPPVAVFDSADRYAQTLDHEICNVASVIGCDDRMKGRLIGPPFIFRNDATARRRTNPGMEGGASGKRSRFATASPSFAGAAAFGADRARPPLKRELRRRDWPGADGATHMPTNERASIYARITDQIIAAIERGVETKRMPWHHDGSAIYRPSNVVSKKAYRGINTLALWASAEAKGYPTGQWGTFKQWFELGAIVRKGERASAVVLWKQVEAPDAEDTEKKRFFARGYSVFNLAQVEHFEPEAVPTLPDTERLAHAEAFIAALNISITHGGDMAYYRPSTDTVHLPPFERFFDAASAYGVTLHECGHASGAKHRLDRDLSGRFGAESYAAEEICVELASGFVLADLGIAHNPREDHAAYIASWLEILKSDPRAIFTAASKAQAIADWMHAQQSIAVSAPAVEVA